MGFNKFFSKLRPVFKQEQTFFIGAIVFVCSIITFLWQYQNPPHLFWDENYFIASAYKYLNKVFFMEPHPPLGKLLIAAGEYIIQPNKHLNTSAFLSTDYITSVPDGFSFAGVRLFPALFGAGAAVLFYLVIVGLIQNSVVAGLFSALYVFENTIILQSRGAMLDSIQIFFVLGSIWWLVRMIENKSNSVIDYGILGFWIGLSMSVKLNSWITCLFPIVLIAIRLQSILTSKQRKNTVQLCINELYHASIPFFIAGLVFVGIFFIHIGLGQKVIQNNFYLASSSYKEHLGKQKGISPSFFSQAILDNLSYIPHYEKGVPAYDACKQGENGSMPLTWPFMNKTINYRWESGEGKTQYLYLVGNPVIWLFGLLGVVGTFILIFSHLIFGLVIKEKRLFRYMIIFFFLYSGYMLSMIAMKRVMYLYHYFIPLFISCLLGTLLYIYILKDKKIKETHIYISLGVIVVFIFSSFVFFSPFTYYAPMSQKAFEMRNWFSFWHLSPIL